MRDAWSPQMSRCCHLCRPTSMDTPEIGSGFMEEFPPSMGRALGSMPALGNKYFMRHHALLLDGGNHFLEKRKNLATTVEYGTGHTCSAAGKAGSTIILHGGGTVSYKAKRGLIT